MFAASGRLGKHVYRVSSVYGIIDTRYRMGLIPTLLRDGLRRQVSTIAGSPSTLRDFVWLEDVGRYIALDILSSLGAKAKRGPFTFAAAGRLRSPK